MGVAPRIATSGSGSSSAPAIIKAENYLANARTYTITVTGYKCYFITFVTRSLYSDIGPAATLAASKGTVLSSAEIQSDIQHDHVWSYVVCDVAKNDSLTFTISTNYYENTYNAAYCVMGV